MDSQSLGGTGPGPGQMQGEQPTKHSAFEELLGRPSEHVEEFGLR